MFQSAITALHLVQIPVRGGLLTPEEASLVFSGPKFLVALFAGILMAFAFQLLLTNLSVAVGISALGTGSGSDSDESQSRIFPKKKQTGLSSKSNRFVTR